jgi:hypothetical protein
MQAVQEVQIILFGIWIEADGIWCQLTIDIATVGQSFEKFDL